MLKDALSPSEAIYMYFNIATMLVTEQFRVTLGAVLLCSKINDSVILVDKRQ